jgi:UDP-2,3-diacylglucosamine pyrophosphatase LpxH
MHRKEYFVSDLHVFSRRSQAARHQAALQAAAAQAHTFILGGDIFDFRWSTFHSTDETVKHAVRWLDDFVGSHPRCDFHFVQGNHDCNRRFLAALSSYATTRKNLHVHPYVLRLGKRAFLHGDVVDHPEMCQARLTKRREHWGRDEARRGEIRNKLYDLAVQARLHALAGSVAHPKKRAVHRLLGYLNRVGQGQESGVEHVYFGHTHRPLENYQYQGVTFHNPGAPIAGLEFRIVETTS